MVESQGKVERGTWCLVATLDSFLCDDGRVSYSMGRKVSNSSKVSRPRWLQKLSAWAVSCVLSDTTSAIPFARFQPRTRQSSSYTRVRGSGPWPPEKFKQREKHRGHSEPQNAPPVFFLCPEPNEPPNKYRCTQSMSQKTNSKTMS